ncbi:translin-associated factor X-interacting protein 1 [Brachyistius frenatus]|uniref:translin-associated factor X-interacting protein 1 n=1 Tax=Brachyistius frenatus TaxID=100188 RepID=UPI0037E720D9
MSPLKEIKFPPLSTSQKQRLTYEHSPQDDTGLTSEEGHEGERDVSVQPRATRKLCWTGSSYIYAGRGRKPELLLHLESFANKELRAINPHEPKYQELKLQVYRSVFGCFMEAFVTYRPLLSAVQKEYENTLAHQRDQIRELEPLRSRLSLATEECERKIQARWGAERAEIGVLKRERRQLQRDVEAVREKEKATQTVVEHLQSELNQQYLQYREERDARKLLIWQLNDLTRGSVETQHPAGEHAEESQDRVELQLALQVCRGDLTEAQRELNAMRADYWDVVPRRDWEALELKHKDALLQLKTLQVDFEQLKSEYDTLLELHKTVETRVSTAVQTDERESQSQIQCDQPEEPINSAAPESGVLAVQESREALRTAQSNEETDEWAASVQQR